MHVCSSCGQQRRCSIVCGAVPQSQVISASSRYPHLLRFALHLPTPALNLFRHFHTAQLESAPGGKSSLAGTVVFTGFLASLFSHILILSLVADGISGVTWVTKLVLDFKRLSAGTWPNIGCLSSVVWRWRSCILATVRLTSGGAILARVYRVSVGVALRQPVIKRQLALRAESNFLACDDLSHTGLAYSADE